jgi:plastocyanin
MRRSLLVLSALALALVAAGCFPTAGPAWTYAPPTPAPAVTPAPSGASAAPSAGASTAPSAGASAAPSEAASGGTGGDIVQVSASGVQFEQQAITAPANTVFTIHFDNKDASTLHNVEIKDGSGMTMFKGALVNGPAQADYQVPALPAGAYTFNCTVHPNMTGTLTVGP